MPSPLELPPHVLSSLNRAGIPPRYLFSRFDNYQPTPENAAEFSRLSDEYMPALLDGGPNNLVLAGSVGTGKTHLACSIAYQALGAGIRTWFVPMNVLFHKLRLGRGQPLDDELGEHKLWMRATQVSLLILDDVGASGMVAWNVETMDTLISERYNALRPTIMTTNFAQSCLLDMGLSRVLDRITGYQDFWLTFVGDSHRPVCPKIDTDRL